MGMAKARYAKVTNGERGLAAFVPYSTHVGPNTVVTKDGEYMRTWRVEGITHETADPEDIQIRMDQLNTVLRAIGRSQVALWVHNVRRKVTDRLESKFDNEFCRQFDKKYYDAFNGVRMMANEIYFTLVYRPILSRAEKAAVRASRRKPEQLLEDQQAAMFELDAFASQVEASLNKYGLEPLGEYDHPRAGKCSSLLEFFNFLLSGEWQPVKLLPVRLDGFLANYLGTAQVFVGTETIEIRGPARSRFAQCIDFKDYPEFSEPGLLNDLMYEPYEYVMSQSFSFMSRADGTKFLKRQQSQLRAAEDGAGSQIAQISHAIDALVGGQFAMGEYHFSLMIFADDRKELSGYVSSAYQKLQDCGFLAAKVSTATDAAFYAQLPGNWKYRPRLARITSINFAGLASLHNFGAGKRNGNPWGEAVTLLKTPSMQPFYFNFHASREDEDAFDRKLLGNTRVIGASGTGKTVLMGVLLAQLQKYKATAPNGFSTVFFDKDRGAELLIRAIGGKYLAIKNGEPTGFNPFQMEPNERNIQFLESWVADRCRGDDPGEARERLSAEDQGAISHAVRTVMRMPRQYRSLTTVEQNLPEGLTRDERSNSLSRRLQKWCRGGTLGWVADCDDDQVDFTTHDNYGFDGTAFLDNKLVCTAISSYLLHRMEEVIDGRRFAYFMDEAWKWVDDEAFATFAGNKQLTIRKQNGFGVFATQMPSSLLESKIGSALVQQVATEIYLPNPRADHGEYINGFKVTEAEFQMIREFDEDSRLMLVKQGHRSAVATLDLRGFDDELAILSGSTDNIELLDAVLADVGEDPADWMPEFKRRLEARRALK